MNYAFPGAKLRLGLMYLKGWGVKNDPVQAIRWLKSAAAHDDADESWQAMVELGKAYKADGNGITANSIQALTWFTRAHKKNFAPGTYQLGLGSNSNRSAA